MDGVKGINSTVVCSMPGFEDSSGQDIATASRHEADLRSAKVLNAQLLTERTAHIKQIAAARYVAHKLFVHKYAIAAMTGDMDISTAHKHYDEAMRNYDGIIAGAVDGASEIANASELAKGANAIDELLKAH